MGQEENVDNCIDHLLVLEEEYMQDVSDLAPIPQSTTYTEMFEQTFKNQNKAGFVVANAPWEKKKGGGGGGHGRHGGGSAEAAPNTASHEDFPGFGSNDVNDAPQVAPSAWNQYR